MLSAPARPPRLPVCVVDVTNTMLGPCTNDALMDTSALAANVHGWVRVHEPPRQPTNVDVPSAVAVSVTAAPSATVSVHDVEQLWPPGVNITVPLPPSTTV